METKKSELNTQTKPAYRENGNYKKNPDIANQIMLKSNSHLHAVIPIKYLIVLQLFQAKVFYVVK